LGFCKNNSTRCTANTQITRTPVSTIAHQKVEISNRRTVRFSRQETIKPTKAGPEYLTAASQAIDQLGEIADRGELLQCAEMILKSNRQQPVDI